MNEKKSEFNVLMPGKSTEAGTNRRTALQAALGVRYTHPNDKRFGGL
jgi:hypothetical protein